VSPGSPGSPGNDARWIRVTTTDGIPKREGRAVSLGGMELASFDLGDRFLAVENRCPHQGGPLSDGIVSGCAVVCPLHAWKVRLDTGEVDRPGGTNACVSTYATRVEDGVVLVQLPALARTPGGSERAA
jgi:nitrite reductase (NADH) small subunit